MKILPFVLAALISSSACAAPTEFDPQNIVVDGQHYTPSDYIEQFCLKKYTGPSDKNCLKVMSEAHAE